MKSMATLAKDVGEKCPQRFVVSSTQGGVVSALCMGSQKVKPSLEQCIHQGKLSARREDRGLPRKCTSCNTNRTIPRPRSIR